MTRIDDIATYSKATTRTILKKAQAVVKEEVALNGGRLKTPNDQIPKFATGELKLGRIVGRGGFSVVHYLENIKLSNGNDTESNETDSAGLWKSYSSSVAHSDVASNVSKRDSASIASSVDRLSLNNHLTVEAAHSRESLARCLYNNNRKQKVRFVVKVVDMEQRKSHKVNFLRGMVDLAMEAKFLSILSHPNIVELQGVSSDSKNPCIILEYLPEILPKRLTAWMHDMRQTKGVTGLMNMNLKRKTTKLLVDRLLVAFDIATALDYLHGQRIVYRDIKPGT